MADISLEFLTKKVDELQRRLKSDVASHASIVDGGGGGTHMNQMNERLARLEECSRAAARRLRAVNVVSRSCDQRS